MFMHHKIGNQDQVALFTTIFYTIRYITTELVGLSALTIDVRHSLSVTCRFELGSTYVRSKERTNDITVSYPESSLSFVSIHPAGWLTPCLGHEFAHIAGPSKWDSRMLRLYLGQQHQVPDMGGCISYIWQADRVGKRENTYTFIVRGL